MARKIAREKGDAGPAATAPARGRITMLDEVIGQEAARRILRSALKSERVHHAWIFHGPAGVGKFTAAYAFAAALLDPTTGAGLSGELAPEPGSPVQELCRGGTHPDLHVITKELAAISREKKTRDGKQTSISKDVLEEFLLEPAARTRVMSGSGRMGKVFIVDEAEMVTAQVQNILLKTMEEPAPGTAIILVTSSEDRLLPTIRSRCQRIAFQALDDREMDEWFKRAGEEGLEPARARWVRGFAAGSPGMARLAIDSDLFQWHEATGPLLSQADRGVFPPELGPTLAKLISERAEADVKANPEASKDAANKAWARRMLAFIAEHYRGKIRAGAGGVVGVGGAGSAANDAMHRWLSSLAAVQGAEGHVAANVNLTMALENLAAQLSVEHAIDLG